MSGVKPLGAVALIATLVLAGTLAAPHSAKADAAPVSFTVLGDSNTTGHSGTLAAGLGSGASWVAHAQSASVVYANDGWAMDGATSTNAAANAAFHPSDDWLVIMIGTNDVKLGLSHDTRVAAIGRMIPEVGAQNVLFLATPPQKGHESAEASYNSWFRSYASDHGYHYLDPWATVRNKSGNWLNSSVTTDGRHGTPATYAIVGAAVLADLTKLSGS